MLACINASGMNKEMLGFAAISPAYMNWINGIKVNDNENVNQWIIRKAWELNHPGQ